MADIRDPREEGTRGLRGLQGINSVGPYTPITRSEGIELFKQGTLNAGLTPIQQVGSQYIGVNDSRYDRRVEDITQLNDLQQHRATEQSGLLQILNGTAKGALQVGTTFLDGTVGLVAGIAQGIANVTDDNRDRTAWSEFIEGLWNNPVSQALKQLNEAAERELPNYYTKEELEREWYENLGTANFWGDKFIKNIGFTVGAYLSGKAWTKPLGLIGKLKEGGTGAAIASGLGASMSAVNEGRIEALNNATDWENLQIAKLGEAYKEDYAKAELYKGTDFYESIIEDIDARYNRDLNKIKENKARVGNLDLALNLPVLLASDMIVFGKLYSRGFNTAKRLDNIGGKPRVNKKTGEILGDYTSEIKLPKIVGQAKAAITPAIIEGTEEVLQKAGATVAGKTYEYNLSFNEAEINNDAEESVDNFIKNFWNANKAGFKETLTESSTWEEFFIGALTGMLGMPTFGKANNAEAWLGKDKIIGLSGGAVQKVKDYNREVQETQEVIDYMNKRLKDPKFLNYYRGMTRHYKFQEDMDNAVTEGKVKEFKDAEYAQLISDVQMFTKAGKLDDYMAILEGAFDTSDENLRNIVELTRTEKTDSNGNKIYVGPFNDKDGNSYVDIPAAEGEESKKDEMITKLTEARDEILKGIKDYSKASDDLDMQVGNKFTDKQKQELIWLKLLYNNQYDRAKGLANTIVDFFKLYPIGEFTKEFYTNTSGKSNLELVTSNAKNILRALDSVTFENIDDANEASSIPEKLLDIQKLVIDAERNKAKYEKYISNPNSLQKVQAKEDKKEKEKIKENKAKEQRDNIDSATSVSDVRNIASNLQTNEELDAFNRAINESNNPHVKQYKEITNTLNEAKRAVTQASVSPQEKTDALKLIDNALNKAQSMDSLREDSELFIDTSILDPIDNESVDSLSDRLNNASKLVLDSIRSSDKSNDDLTLVPEVLDLDAALESNPNSNTERTTGSQEVTQTAPIPQNPQPKPTDSIKVEDLSNSEDISVDNDDFVSNDADRTIAIKELNEQSEDKDKSQVRKFWQPAMGEFSYESMATGIFEDANNADWKVFKAYMESKGGYIFINSGELAKYGNNPIYFGIDADLNSKLSSDKPTIVMFAKVNDTYIPLGSLNLNYLERYKGLQEFVDYVYNEYNKTDKIGLWISDKTTQVAEIMPGRIPFVMSVRDVKSMLKEEAPHLVTVDDSGQLHGNSAGTFLINAPLKSGMSYIEVPNARGKKSLVAVIPNRYDDSVINSPSKIANAINEGITYLAQAITSGDTRAIANAMKNLGQYLTISKITVSKNKNTGDIYIKEVIDKKNQSRPFDIDRVLFKITPNSDIEFIENGIKDSLKKVNIHVRINRELQDNVNYRRDLIDSGFIKTHATSLEVKAAWFKVKPVDMGTSKAETEQVNPVSSQETNKKRANRFNTGKTKDVSNNRKSEQSKQINQVITEISKPKMNRETLEMVAIQKGLGMTDAFDMSESELQAYIDCHNVS